LLVSPQALVIPYVLTPAELDGLLRVGEALANISERLSVIMGRSPAVASPASCGNGATVALDLDCEHALALTIRRPRVSSRRHGARARRAVAEPPPAPNLDAIPEGANSFSNALSLTRPDSQQ
jgi:hypothetical protein